MVNGKVAFVSGQNEGERRKHSAILCNNLQKQELPKKTQEQE